MTPAEMVARIAVLEETLAQRAERTPQARADKKAAKAAAKARRAKFKREAQQRARLHITINRYSRSL
jgi:hypothetical protein